ncbi:MAG: response regulator [Flavobacteriaceae bacterium]
MSYFSVYAQDSNTQILSNQIQDIGLPYIQNYESAEYEASGQNWGAVQDSLGVMYFANGDGVLTYNGVNWDLILLPNKATVFALAKDKNGRIYVGAIDEFGYIEPNSKGQLTYVSFLPKLTKKYHDFSEIRTICLTEYGLFFNSKKYSFRWDGEKFDSWENTGDSFMFSVHNTVLKRIKGKGLMEFKNNQFKLVPKGELFANNKIYSILPYKENEFLITTRDKLFLYNGIEFIEFKTNIPDFFIDNVIYTGVALNNGSFAFGSLNKGVLIIDNKGRKKIVLSQKERLKSNVVLGLFQDDAGLLWASLSSGIAKIEYPSPFSFFKTPDLVLSILKYQKKIFVGGPEGLFYLENQKKSENSLFKKVKGEFGGVWDMILFQDKMLIGSLYGVYEIDKNGKSNKLVGLKISALYHSKIDNNRVFIGSESGLSSMYFKNNKWKFEYEFKGVNTFVDKIVEKHNGDLWLGVDKNETIGIFFNNINDAQNLIKPKVKIFTTKDGLPDNIGENFIIKDQVYFASGNDVYKFDSKSQKFFRDKELFIELGVENKNVKINFVDEQENIWLIEYNGDNKLDQLVAFLQKDKTYKLKKLNEKRIINIKKFGAYPELEDSIVWYKGRSGIVRHDLKKKYNRNTINSKTIISSVLCKNDSLLFGGYESSIVPELLFKHNQLRFQYASTSFYDESKNKFQYFLEGFDKDWSSWTSETKKDYTNIPEGDYSFKVRSKNIFNHIGKEDHYSFIILPPWYRTWWMYLVYGLGAIGIILLITQWRSNQLYKKNVALERVIKERTSEIVQKNRQLEDQTEQLKVVDKMKTRLFANISHEFRTPLTLIKGPIEQLEKYPEKKLSISNVKMIRRNANRLLKLVNQLLDLSKLESGNLELESSEGNVYKCLRAAASSFSSHAAQRNMDYQIKIPSNKILWALFDRDKLEKIIYNLLSNAFKFTEDDGIVSISVKFSNEQLKIEVADSGCGILPEGLPLIFDRFFQVDDSFTKEKEGTGIGLSLTKELVKLMQGTINVESDYKKGSVFKITIPLEEIKTAQKEDKEEFTVKIKEKETSVTIKSQNKDLPTILIVEDNEDMRDFIKQQLEEEYQISEAYNGQDGLEKALKTMPNLIITDLMMPKIDGISLCKQLKKDINTSHIPIIMLTAKAGIENKIEGLETGADDYLTKPFNSKELHARIKNLIEQRKKLRELFSKKDIINPKEVTVTSLDEQFLQKIIDLLEEQYSNSNFAIPQMREDLAMSNAQLHRKVKALTDQSPGELLRNFRLKRAAQILKQKGAYVTEVAYDVGFNNLSYFAKCFKEFHGVSPSVFSKKNLNS